MQSPLAAPPISASLGAVTAAGSIVPGQSLATLLPRHACGQGRALKSLRVLTSERAAAMVPVLMALTGARKSARAGRRCRGAGRTAQGRLGAVGNPGIGRPALPLSVSQMMRQASDSIAAAYEDGISRQWVRLRLDMTLPKEESRSGDLLNQPLPPEFTTGCVALHKAALPYVRELVGGLNGTALKELKVALIDDDTSPDIGTLLYREAEDSKEDAAVFFLAGRRFATAGSTPDFLAGMKERLVVMLNSEDAASTFMVENEGSDFQSEPFGYEAAVAFCKTFEAQTYHYSTRIVNGWQVMQFRAYPQPWEFYIVGLDGNTLKLKETLRKPSFEQMAAWTVEFEKSEQVSPMAKREKSLE
mmetsp:Transcript_18031/g.35385  ORF Transcript_18031/g.35385 Transcript_18031/m.35385 type:complete len:359 (+) Transcript_18031:53-1129(+)